MARIAVIGGTGLSRLEGFTRTEEISAKTPFGTPSAPLEIGAFAGHEIVFLARHGREHGLAPHRVNYRANIWALREAGVAGIFAVAAVGGIREPYGPAKLAVVDQIVDYTTSRANTFFEDAMSPVVHIDFTQPYDEPMRQRMLRAAQAAGVEVIDGGTYGATEGPRLETAAEIDRLERDGCDVVGMTGMPEAALARELELPYATCAVVVNWAAGRSDEPVTLETMRKYLGTGLAGVARVLGTFVRDS